MNSLPYKDCLASAHRILDEVRPILLQSAGNPDHVETKADGTKVTNIDPLVEGKIRAMLMKQFPDIGILGEEDQPYKPEAPYRWILDPLDGTSDYIEGNDSYGAILALYKGDASVFGLIDIPEHGDRYEAIAGQHAHCNGSPISVMQCKLSDNPKIAMSVRRGFEKAGLAEAHDRLYVNYPNLEVLPNCYGHGLAARGEVAAMVNVNISLWDIASTRPLIEGAGGSFYTRERQDTNGNIKYDMVCGNPCIVEWLVKELGI